MNIPFQFVKPILFRLDPETAHRATLLALRSGIVAPGLAPADRRLETCVAGINFANPIGMAAGFDKDGEVINPLMQLGFGHVEIGSVTPKPQPGNVRPRVFRLTQFGGVINRFGFNSAGHATVARRLGSRTGSAGILGVNVGANKDSPDFIADYEAGIGAFSHLADYFTINVSSPNTPGLRKLQDRTNLVETVKRCLAARDKACGDRNVPVFIKIAPDLDDDALDDIAMVIKDSRADGMVISNTTLSRAGVSGVAHAGEAGGLSGRPLFHRATVILAKMRQRLGHAIPIIGVGGVDGAETALAKIEAGADLVQLYTGMIFNGPMLVHSILQGMIARLEAENTASISDLKGIRTREWAARDP